MRILVTGASGFLGRRLCGLLHGAGHEVVAACREPGVAPVAAEIVAIGPIEDFAGWSPLMDGVEAVVHLAAVTHSRDLAAPSAWPHYEAVNVRATRVLAEAAGTAGVRRFVYLSSIKVNGENTSGEALAAGGYTFADPPAPRDNYGLSKWQAEQALRRAAQNGSLQVTVLRPPLVYGPGMKGNLLRLMQWVAARKPLPLAGVENRRSMIYVDNLADAIARGLVAAHAGFAGFTLADVTLSTPQLVIAIADALNVQPRLFHAPLWLMRAGAVVSGRRDQFDRLFGSLVVSAARARAELAWQPRVSFDAAMHETAAWFIERRT